MNRFIQTAVGALLGALLLLTLAATVKISDLPLKTNWSTNTFIEIADMNAATKSGKVLLTNLVTQAELDDLPTGGDTIWTNSAGVIQSMPTNSNVLSFTSQLADNATNVAMVIGASSLWSNGVPILSGMNSNTRSFFISADGAFAGGQNAYSQSATDQFIEHPTLVARRTTSLGEDTHFLFDVGSSTHGNVYDGGADIFAAGDTNYIYFQVGVDKPGRNGAALTFSAGYGGLDDCTLGVYDTNNAAVFKFQPLSVVQPDDVFWPLLFFSSSIPTVNSLLQVQNDFTNMFQVHYNGSITTGGNTNRWIFKSVTEGASTNIVVNINGKDYTFQAW